MFVCIPSPQENGPKATEGVNVSVGISLMSGWRGEFTDASVRKFCYEFLFMQNVKSLIWLLDVRNSMRRNAACATSFCIGLTRVFITAALSMSSSAKGKGAN